MFVKLFSKLTQVHNQTKLTAFTEILINVILLSVIAAVGALPFYAVLIYIGTLNIHKELVVS